VLHIFSLNDKRLPTLRVCQGGSRVSALPINDEDDWSMQVLFASKFIIIIIIITTIIRTFTAQNQWCGRTVVERRSLTGESLLLVCT